MTNLARLIDGFLLLDLRRCHRGAEPPEPPPATDAKPAATPDEPEPKPELTWRQQPSLLS